MDKMQKNMQTVRLDLLINIATWVNTSFIIKIRRSPIVKSTPKEFFELAPKIYNVELPGCPKVKKFIKNINITG
jgi:hypothetical protein